MKTSHRQNPPEQAWLIRRLRQTSTLLLGVLMLAGASDRASAAVTDGLLFYAPFENSSPNDTRGGKVGLPGGNPAYVTTAGIIGNFVRLANDAVQPETYVF